MGHPHAQILCLRKACCNDFPYRALGSFALCSTVWLFNWRVIYIALPHHRAQHHSHSLTHSLRLPNSRSARRALKSMKKGLFIFSRESSRLQAARGAFLRPAGAAAAWLAGRSGPNLLVRPKVRGPWACRAPPPLDEKCLSCCASPPPPPSPGCPLGPTTNSFAPAPPPPQLASDGNALQNERRRLI